MGRSSHDTQLCWACKKATNNGCDWSEHLKPVKGWEAYLNVIYGLLTYKVIRCPEFENDNACINCRHKKGEEHCQNCLYTTECGLNSKVKWEGKQPCRQK